MSHPYGLIDVSGQPSKSLPVSWPHMDTSKRPASKLGSGSMVEGLLSMHKALGSMPSAQIKKNFISGIYYQGDFNITELSLVIISNTQRVYEIKELEYTQILDTSYNLSFKNGDTGRLGGINLLNLLNLPDNADKQSHN